MPELTAHPRSVKVWRPYRWLDLHRSEMRCSHPPYQMETGAQLGKGAVLCGWVYGGVLAPPRTRLELADALQALGQLLDRLAREAPVPAEGQDVRDAPLLGPPGNGLGRNPKQCG